MTLLRDDLDDPSYSWKDDEFDKPWKFQWYQDKDGEIIARVRIADPSKGFTGWFAVECYVGDFYIGAASNMDAGKKLVEAYVEDRRNPRSDVYESVLVR